MYVYVYARALVLRREGREGRGAAEALASVKAKDVFGQEIGGVGWVSAGFIWTQSYSVMLCDGLAF